VVRFVLDDWLRSSSSNGGKHICNNVSTSTLKSIFCKRWEKVQNWVEMCAPLGWVHTCIYSGREGIIVSSDPLYIEDESQISLEGSFIQCVYDMYWSYGLTSCSWQSFHSWSVVVYRGDMYCSLFGCWISVYWALAGLEQLTLKLLKNLFTKEQFLLGLFVTNKLFILE
jgi:DMSO/TMAO reductase YedYZ heme-binding membrane subunit